MNFDPDKYLADKDAPGKSFDPDEYLKTVDGPPSQLESGLRGAAQGASAGWSDELEGGARAVYNKFVGGDMRPMGALYDEGRATARRANEAAAEANPKTYLGSELAGGVGTALLPIGAAAKVPGLIRAGVAGAGMGLGYSEADNLKDAAVDTGLGAATGGVGYGLGQAVTKGVPKVISAVLGPKEEAIKNYLLNQKGVNAARSFPDLGKETHKALQALKQKGIQGSQAATELIPEEGMVNVAPIQHRFNELLSKYEGAGGFGQASKAAKSSIEGLKDEFGGLVKNQEVSLRDMKNVIKALDLETKLAKNAGQFSSPENLAKQQLRQDIDKLLKSEVPAYRDAMTAVADDFRTLTPASQEFGVKKVAGRLKKAATHEGPEQDLLKNLSEKSGKDIIGEAKNRLTKEEFLKDQTRGSKGVNLGGMLAGGALGVGSEAYGGNMTLEGLGKAGAVGAIGGALRDKYGGRVAKKMLDAYLASGRAAKAIPGVRQAIEQAQKKGPEALAITLYLLKKQYPELMEEK